ncbi:hypothetical protein BCR36DRAFT_585008 [Piromyces finnis]|uniref:Uncharacterized protein n=1 Tax=Piromyces finnis TaxID=1754191 RepID=A0A1Y1V659_9FUNG|nr:hypothetical protein BCR36DRAFT_585008 [Piromyces finnis]|eukprot:ORX46903.1 hypothetical protein BCR36DRAFT_585008 [Piromyces finnis]
MVRIERLISYLSNEKNNEDILGESILFKEKFNYRREENNIINPTSDMKNASYPTKNRRSPAFYRGKLLNGYQCKKSSLHYSFTADSLITESDNKSEDIIPTIEMTAVPKKTKSSKGFFSSLTKKLLPTKRSSISRKYSNHICNGKSISKQKTKYYNNNHSLNNKYIINIPMQVIETLYTISFTKHSYYIQRSLRRSTMIVNLITRFRNTYEELREIDVPKLKRRISFKKRVPTNKQVKKSDQPREGSLIELREERRARYCSIFGNQLPYYNNYSSYATYGNGMDDNTFVSNAATTISHTNPRRKKKIPKKPLLEFGECESLPSIPVSAAGYKVNQYLTCHKEAERKKLKPIKSIDKELCLIFNKEYIPEDEIQQQQQQQPNENEMMIKMDEPSMNEDLPQETASPIFSLSSNDEEEEDSFVKESNEPNPEDLSVFSDTDREERKEENEIENEKPSEIIPSPSSITTKVNIEKDDRRERKRISEGTLYNEALDETHPSNISAESNSSDKTLKDEDLPTLTTTNNSSFIIMDDAINTISFPIEEKDSNNEDEGEEEEEEEPSFILKLNDSYLFKNKNEKSFSLTESFLLSNNSNESIIPEHMSNFLLNKTNISVGESDFFSDSMSILNNSILNESFSLTLDSYGEEGKSQSSIKDTSSFIKKEERPLNRIDSGIDLSGMNTINILMANQCQV